MKDLHNHLVPVVALKTSTSSDNTALTGATVDRAGAEALEFAILSGSLADADATYAVEVQHGAKSDASDMAAVPDGMLLGTEAGASFKFDEDDTVKKIGYVGDKRYVRIVITPANNASAATFSALAIKGHLRSIGGDPV